MAQIVALVLAAMSTAEAAPGAVVVGGGAEDRRLAVTDAIGQAVREAGWTVPAAPVSKADATALLQCAEATSPWTCMPPSFASLGIERALVISLQDKAGDEGPVVVLVGRLIMTNPESAVVRQRFCEHCADDRLRSEAIELARHMLREQAVRSGRTVVTFRSEPPGAAIVLDGERVGATNSTYNTFPGKHVAVIEKPGFESETREFTAEEGRGAEVAVALRTSGPGPAAPPREQASRMVPALVIGAGAVALGVGIALQAAKDGPAVGEAQPSRVYSAPGIGLMIAGGVVAGAGGYLWFRASKQQSSAPVVSLHEGGGVLGWSYHY